MRKALLLLGMIVCAIPGIYAQSVTQGSLFASDSKGKQLGACPLKHTAINVDVSGFVARVRVVQEFENTFTEPIEAVYTFPLSQTGAVDSTSTMTTSCSSAVAPDVTNGEVSSPWTGARRRPCSRARRSTSSGVGSRSAGPPDTISVVSARP